MKTRTTIILCFVCASILAWYAPMPVFSAQDPLTRNLSPTVHRIVYQAQEALQAEKYGKAAEILREFDLKHPDKPDALVCYLLGNAYYMNNKKEAAYRSYRRGIEATTDSAMLWINLAAVAYELNHTSEAATYFRKAFDLSDPPDYDLLYQAGAAHYQAREYAKAKVALSELVRPQAKVEKPWLQLLIHTYLELGELKEAEEFLTLFLERNPTEAAYWRLMAQVRIHRKNYVEAAAALEIAYRLSPPDVAGWKELAGIYMYIGTPQRGAILLEKAYGPDPSPDQCDEIARAYVTAERPERALVFWNRAIDKDPSPARLLEVGKLHYQHGHWKKAMEVLQRVTDKAPDIALAQLLLGYCAWESGDLPLAERSFQKAAAEKRYKNHARGALATLKSLTSEG